MPEQETELTLSEEASAALLRRLEIPSSKCLRMPPAKSSPRPARSQSAREQFDQLKAERDQLLDRLARLQAEFENARKRAERERPLTATTPPAAWWSSFCPCWTTLSWRSSPTGTAEQLRSGVELIVKQMEDVLRQLQVTPIPAVGEEFDPRQHEALGTVERDDLPDQHVAEEIRRGYKLRDRLLRPALVRMVQTSECGPKFRNR
jgi:molecular chaperone GrpE